MAIRSKPPTKAPKKPKMPRPAPDQTGKTYARGEAPTMPKGRGNGKKC